MPRQPLGRHLNHEPTERYATSPPRMCPPAIFTVPRAHNTWKHSYARQTIRGLSTGPPKISENLFSSGSTTAFRKGPGFVGTWSCVAFRLKHYTRPSFLTAIPASKSGPYLHLFVYKLFVCDLNHIQKAANTRYNTTAEI